MNSTDAAKFVEMISAPLLSGMGAMFAIALSGIGAAIGTAKIGSWILSDDSTVRPDEGRGEIQQPFISSPAQQNTGIMKYFVGVIMAGMQAIYGLIVAVMIVSSSPKVLTMGVASGHFAAGLAVGISALAAGYAIGYSHGPKPRDTNFVRQVLLWVYCEAIGLYGLIIALICISSSSNSTSGSNSS